MPAPVTVRVNCDPEGRLPRAAVADLMPFQRELKGLSDERYAKLRLGLQDDGILSPCLVWVAPDGSYHLLDGHQRLRVIEREGWEVEGGGVPYVTVNADTEQDAARRLLLLVSQYGQIDGQGLYEFGAHFDLDLASIDNLALPEVDWEAFKTEFYDSEAYQQEAANSKAAVSGVQSTIAFPPSVWIRQRQEVIAELQHVLDQFGGTAEWAE